MSTAKSGKSNQKSMSVSLETGKIVRVFILSTSFTQGVYLLMSKVGRGVFS